MGPPIGEEGGTGARVGPEVFNLPARSSWAVLPRCGPLLRDAMPPTTDLRYSWSRFRAEEVERVACGNNKVSRSYLSSQPSSASQQGHRLFNETKRAPEQLMVTNKKGAYKLVEAMYSGNRKDGTVERYLDENRNETFNASLHIHEIHEPNGDVFLHITDRRAGGPAQHSDHVVLKQASGSQVNAAEQRLAGIMRSMNKP